MNIAIISTYDLNGGAARAAFRLHKGLRGLGERSSMVVRDKTSGDETVCGIGVRAPLFPGKRDIYSFTQRHALDFNRTDLSNTLFSMPYPGYDISNTGPIRRADVINLHWVSQYQSIESVAGLLSLGKPVVWTLHDENTYTGGCHYTAQCGLFRTGCRDCPQLREDPHQLAARCLQLKLESWTQEGSGRSLTVVTPSRWLGQRAASSQVFAGRRVEVIPNSVETDVFAPVDRAAARRSLGIDERAVCLLFAAMSHDEKRKGYHKLLEGLELCREDVRFRGLVTRGRVLLCTVGLPQTDIARVGIPLKTFGFIDSDEALSKIYAAADMYVLPSLEDNLPNAMLEAMACGIPVVAYAAGGMPDVIEDQITGRLVPAFSSRQLADAIVSLALDRRARQEMGRRCRQVVEKRFRLDVQASAYLELFRELAPGPFSCCQRRIERESEAGRIRENGHILLKSWPHRESGLCALYRLTAIRLIRQQRGAAAHTWLMGGRGLPMAAALHHRLEVLVLESPGNWWGNLLLALLGVFRTVQGRYRGVAVRGSRL